MKITYGWKAGSRIKIDAEKAWEEMEMLGKEKTPRQILTYAEKHKKSELYKHFQWDNEIAGDLYRLQQAGYLLRSIVVKKEKGSEKGEKQVIIMRAFESVGVKDDDEEGDKLVYVSTETALSVPEHREYVINNIRKAINELREKACVYDMYLKNKEQFSKGLGIALDSV